MKCFECEKGVYKTQFLLYKTLVNGREIEIERVPHEICDTCGDICLSSDVSRMIEEARKEAGAIYKNRIRK
jgi:YgiT-type zinc finger domain-containing protein